MTDIVLNANFDIFFHHVGYFLTDLSLPKVYVCSVLNFTREACGIFFHRPVSTESLCLLSSKFHKGGNWDIFSPTCLYRKSIYIYVCSVLNFTREACGIFSHRPVSTESLCLLSSKFHKGGMWDIFSPTCPYRKSMFAQF